MTSFAVFAGGCRRRAVAVVVGLLGGLAVVSGPAAGTALAIPHIYWANVTSNTIGEANLDGTGVNQNFITGAGGPIGVAVDGQHVYWANFAANTIGEANLDGSGVNQSFITGADQPEGVAVDGQHVYWANLATNTIAEANLNGSGVNQSFITGANEPVGVAVDGQHVYWANDGNNTIGVANLDGTGVNQSFITGANAPVGVAVDGQHVYWADDGNNTIGAANLDGTGVNQSFITTAGVVGDPAVSVPVARVSPGAPAVFASTPQGSLSAPVTLTVTNAGQRALSLTGLSFAGANPGDFLVGSDSCLGNVDPGNSCQLEVYFSPEAQGARSATLQIATTDYANSPLQVPLSGTGASLPTGPTGPPGSTGPQGPTGSTGLPGAAGQVELITCKTVTTTVIKEINGKPRKVTVKRQKCTGELVSGTVKFTVGGAVGHATITRKQTVYATGVSVSTANGTSQLVLTDLRPLPRGRYTLTLENRHGRRSTTRRTQLTLR